MTRASHSLPLVAFLLCACDTEPIDTGDAPPSDPRRWEALMEELPGVLLSVGGRSRDDVWTVGADAGEGPEVHHWDGAEWTALDAGVRVDLWWVYAQGDEGVWFCGADGTLLNYDRDTAVFSPVISPTTATLFGIWGASPDLLYAVGGFIDGSDGDDGVVVRIEAGVATEVTDLPVDRDVDEMYFKVWGTGADDVWVVGDAGSVLHYNGATWTRRVMPGAPRLVTIAGSGGDVVVVGGSTQGVVFEQVDGGWTDVAPSYLQPLNGVYVAASGAASAAGFSGATLERAEGTWAVLPAAGRTHDWHATWIDDEGAIYTAGGDFMNLVDGALYRYTVP